MGEWGVNHNFSKSINQKVNVIVWLEFELAYFEIAVQHFSHYTTETPSLKYTFFFFLKTNSKTLTKTKGRWWWCMASIHKKKKNNSDLEIYIDISKVGEGDLKAPFSIATTLRYTGGCYSFPWIAPLYLYKC